MGTGTETIALADVQAPLWEPPKPDVLQQIRLKPSVLAMEWAGLGLVYLLILGLCNGPKNSKPPN